MTIAHPFSGEGCTPGRMKADERREQLIRVALELFSRTGFRGTTTKEIAQAAGVTEALIFRHFPTKDALYEAILKWRLEQSGIEAKMDDLRAIAERRDDAALFRAVATGMLEFHRENVDFLRLMFFAVLEDHRLAQSFRERQVIRLYDFLTEYVETRQREGAFVDIDAGAAVRAVLGMPFYHSIVKNIFHCDVVKVDDETAVEAFVRVALEGLKRPSIPETGEQK